MPPTLLQRVLNQPSQKYSPPSPRNYYSAKPGLLALAAVIDDAPRHILPPPTCEEQNQEDDTEVFYTPRSSVVFDDNGADDMSMTITTTPTRALYTDEDWTKELQFLVNKPKRIVPIPLVPTRKSRTPTPSIMMSMTALMEEDELEQPPKVFSTPSSSVLLDSSTPPLTHSRSSTPSHRRTRSTTSSSSVYYTPPSLPSGPPELPSYGTPAYTSLVVPPAPLPSQPLTRSTSISQRIKASFRRDTADLSRSRLAQGTMASIEVVAGLASAKAKSLEQPPRLGFTHYRTPPGVSQSGILVQVWAVGLDAVDIRLLGNTSTAPRSVALLPRPRTQSIGRFVGRSINLSRRTLSETGSVFEKDAKEGLQAVAQVGFIPGRSFVGRVMECGWEVRDEIARRGEWVIGSLDVRKSGALAEYIVVDRHRLHRVPQPGSITPPSSSRSSHDGQDSLYPSRPSSVAFALGESPPPSRPSSRQHRKTRSAPAPSAQPPPGPTLEELALLPLGLAAYRAIRTLIGLEGAAYLARAETVRPDGELEVQEHSPNSRSRHKLRALVINGHAGTGALAARLLVARGWRVCIHAPGTLAEFDVDDEERDREHMTAIQTRARGWGVEEVVFDDGGAIGDEPCDSSWGRAATVRAVDRLIEDGDEFDAVVDTLGGQSIWEAGERLLKRGDGRRKMFATTVGDVPGRPIPTAKDNFRAGLRSMRGEGKSPKKKNKRECVVGYAWANAAQDVDWEGGDIRDGLAALVQLAMEADSIRPHVEDPLPLPFERAVEVFDGHVGVRRGGSVVVKIAG
ncbi:hypothetical protein MIND_00695000 [Mycena indigotica]|uniref:Uncharacterized protein n=1 Tax=Mycena indigotica TaxID=2126181 RepID=A0A8H6SNY2_9AGAR|nr:uncharacterized protein MIND_00695000 [Mycena indigotica]KAF7301300.1 hypothetical protein MIND_00695000 [Mycena indigotica]